MATQRGVSPTVSGSYLGLVVLEPVGLVHHEAGPLDGAQDGLVNGDELIGGEQHMEFDLHFLLWERQECEGGSRDRIDPRDQDSGVSISGNPTSILRNPGGTTLAPGISGTKHNALEKVLLQKVESK